MSSFSLRGDVQPFYAMDILAMATKAKREGRNVISMAVGQPAAPAPKLVLEAAQKALQDGHIGYTNALGLLVLQERIAAYYDEHHGINISPERIAVTTGSSAAFNLAFLAFFDSGDHVAITRPGYPAYRNIMKALGLEVVEIVTGEETGGILTAAALLEEHKKNPLKGVLFASPSNPNGAVIPPQELKKIIDVAREHNIRLISDEIYHRLNYTAKDVSALEYSDDVVVINSFSKYYCMTGWRIGWMVLPQDSIRTVERICQSLYISAPELSQKAAIKAFDATQELELVKDTYCQNREILQQYLPEIGFKLLAPMDGAFYAYCDVSRCCNDSMDFAAKMLRETDVAASPGVDFDVVDGLRTMRFSYAGGSEQMLEAMLRLRKWLG